MPEQETTKEHDPVGHVVPKKGKGQIARDKAAKAAKSAAK